MSKSIMAKIYHDETRFGGNKEKSLIRDNYTCQDCGSREKLVTHHKGNTAQENVITYHKVSTNNETVVN